MSVRFFLSNSAHQDLSNEWFYDEFVLPATICCRVYFVSRSTVVEFISCVLLAEDTETFGVIVHSEIIYCETTRNAAITLKRLQQLKLLSFSGLQKEKRVYHKPQ